MQTKTWNRAVTIEIAGEKRIVARIANTRDAARCLLDYWPVKHGYYYQRAILGCTMALKGQLSDEDARFYLTDAAADAHLTYMISLGPAYLDEFDSAIAAACDESVFRDGISPARQRERGQ